MTSTTPSNTEHEELVSQLPWLANGTLGQAERDQLTQHIAQCKHCSDEYDALTTMNTAINNATTGSPDTNASFARMKQRIAEDENHSTIGNTLQQSVKKWGEWFQPMSTPRWAFAAVCGITAMLFMVQYDSRSLPDSENAYQVLSSAEQSDDLKVFVQLDANLSSSQTEALMSEISRQGDFELTQIETDGHGFNIVVKQSESEPLSSPAALTDFMNTLRTLDGVADVGLSP